jgi:CDP-diacylglycerol---glycerol-3-phosphate 3-phosphatidyltransferase
LGAEKLRLAGRRLLSPLVNLLARAGVSPSAITLAGLALTAGAAILVWSGSYLAGALVLVAGSLLDALDGGVARKLGVVSRAGAVLDSSCDRIGETLVYAAFIAGAASALAPILLYLAPAALGGSYMVSYVRARSEGVGIPCSVGVFTRTERLVLLTAALAAAEALRGPGPIVWICAVIAAGTWTTAVHRLLRVYSEDRQPR